MEKDGTMVKFEMDVAWNDWEETFADVMARIESRTEVKWAVLEEHGPGGGWPVVEFTVAEAKFRELMAALGVEDEGEIAWTWDEAQPA